MFGFAAALGAAFFMAASAAAQGARENVPLAARCVAAWQDGAPARERGLEVVEIVDRDAFLRAFNALPPPTEITADRVFVVRSRREPARGVVVFVVGSCIVGVAPLTADIRALFEGEEA